MKIAVVGAGISGLSCAFRLSETHEVTLFEAEERLGGHTHTVRVDLDGETHYVDTGFIVYNEPNYPLFSALLSELSVATQPSEMSFSVSSGSDDFEYRGNGLGLWAQPSNALRPSFVRLLSDVLRFNRDVRRLLADGGGRLRGATLSDLLAEGRYGADLGPRYLVPLGSAIWSADPERFGDIPAETFARFLDHHGMLQLKGRPRWRTVTGGANRYVEALARRLRASVRLGLAVEKVVREPEAVTLLSAAGEETYDAVVLAVHSDQALALLGDPSRAEREVLGAITYRRNVATLHTDESMLPRRRRAWAAWNAHLPSIPGGQPTVTYWMNRLQRLDARRQLCVSLNREAEIDPALVIGQWSCHHPVFDRSAIHAQGRRGEIQGRRRTWFCGAYWGYGFHEDGVASALDVCRLLQAPP